MLWYVVDAELWFLYLCLTTGTRQRSRVELWRQTALWADSTTPPLECGAILDVSGGVKASVLLPDNKTVLLVVRSSAQCAFVDTIAASLSPFTSVDQTWWSSVNRNTRFTRFSHNDGAYVRARVCP